jgi:hypothetical protein
VCGTLLHCFPNEMKQNEIDGTELVNLHTMVANEALQIVSRQLRCKITLPAWQVSVLATSRRVTAYQVSVLMDIVYAEKSELLWLKLLQRRRKCALQASIYVINAPS